MNVCKWCMSCSATDNSILLTVLPRLNKMFNQLINHHHTTITHHHHYYHHQHHTPSPLQPSPQTIFETFCKLV